MEYPPDAGGTSRPPSLLIVDDDEAICELLVAHLRPLGYRIRVAYTGKAAMAALREEPPDVALLDLRLADMSGQEIHRSIRDRRLDTKVIIMTGFASLDTALDAIRNGAFDYIVKPFNLGEIGVSVRNALERKDLEVRNRELAEQVRALTRRLEREGDGFRNPTVHFEEIPLENPPRSRVRQGAMYQDVDAGRSRPKR